MLLQIITEFDIELLIIAIVTGFIGALLDNSFGMGYGLLTPIFVFLGFDIRVVVPTLLFSQAMTGFAGVVFHQINKNLSFGKLGNRETKVFFLFTIVGILGSLIALIFAVSFSDLFMLVYIGIMMILVGLIVLVRMDFRKSWNVLYVISAVAGFNKAISGGGYGPLVTTGQLMAGYKVRNSVGITQFSEATISTLGFMFYTLFNDFTQVVLTLELGIIMVIAGLVSAPIGARVARKLEERLAKRVVAVLSITLGIITLLRIMAL